MNRTAASVGSAAFFVVAPGTVVGLIPYLITRWQLPDGTAIWRWALVAIALVLIVDGLVPTVVSFAQFAAALGTPMPLAPTAHLVVGGFYRYVRNPMYVGLLLVIAGQALLFQSTALLLYGALVWAFPAAFVRWYEEPTLVEQFGDEYLQYRQHVRAWLPRLRPWTAPPADSVD